VVEAAGSSVFQRKPVMEPVTIEKAKFFFTVKLKELTSAYSVRTGCEI
jgi:hypothetical protein